jgi:hypothetical protein
MALSLLCSQQNSLVPEILYLLSPKQIIDFIKVYGGETLRIPTTQEFNRDLTTALACYHTMIEERSWDWVAVKYNLGTRDLKAVKAKAEIWWTNLSAGERYFIDGLRHHEEARKMEETVR